MSQVFERPWGTYEVLTGGPGYQVKRLIVKPGKRLSLQYHHQRSEDWIVATGEVDVTIGDEINRGSAGDAFHVPIEAKHRIANPAAEGDLTIIEVQLGDYLGEDDIVRLEDDFGRQEPANQ